MNIAIQLFNVRIRKFVTSAVNPLIVRSREYFTSLSFVQSNKYHLAKSRNIFNFLNRDLKRKYMDLTSVIKVFEEKVPHHLAETWDNTGLLIEPSKRNTISTILFTNDLTEVVLEEAIFKKADLIISYHPPIFAPVKSLKISNWKDRIVIKCIENSIAVYSPHTSCDAVADGVNDWLIRCFGIADCHPIHPSYECQPKYSHILDFTVCSGEEICQLIKAVPDSELCGISVNSDKQSFRLKVNKASLNHAVQLLTGTDNVTSVSVTALNPLPIPACGMGRIGKLCKPLMLGECIELVKSYLKLDFIRFARSVSHSLESTISTVAVCAGSGSSILKGVSADLYVTGEMSHHDLLDANHKNTSVILCEHSNSERGYLKHLVETLSSKLTDINMLISSTDKDPIDII